MNPYQLAIGQTVSFLGDMLRGRHHVLEVGCGRGEVARRLGAQGLRVTALDVALPDPAPAANVTFVEGDFLRYDAGPFDAIAFTSSLHHISPLAAAIDRAHDLLAPGGLVIADEFDLDAPSPETLRWYYDVQELLAAAEVLPREHVDPPAADVLQRWRLAHHHEPPLHTGVEMRRAIAERFDLRDVHGAAYLYRYVTRHLPHDARGVAIAQHVYSTERRGITDGSLSAVGLGIVAARA
ncbi:MAG: class I SAM-dependent methyltransferase [Deltaproteobacteria bacterium]|nr:MAG: class I SAM-dependent methyltransferase [Deltaproteobacteria bacterium]TMQ11748.1 MAG: class I SAM-dependent methyltransferase [Deltaproteobacteria bacterium]